MKSFSDKGLEIIKKIAEQDDNIENYHFLKHLINIQSIQNYQTITQYRKDYIDSLNNQISKQRKRKK
tara:strand:- start:666 stop:866 length:201 start_codon:yes stop_codon:yes gene_type:complete